MHAQTGDDWYLTTLPFLTSRGIFTNFPSNCPAGSVASQLTACRVYNCWQECYMPCELTNGPNVAWLLFRFLTFQSVRLFSCRYSAFGGCFRMKVPYDLLHPRIGGLSYKQNCLPCLRNQWACVGQWRWIMGRFKLFPGQNWNELIRFPDIADITSVSQSAYTSH